MILSFYPEARAEPERTVVPIIRDLACLEQPASKKLKLYDGLARIKDDVVSQVDKASKEFKKPSSLLARRRVIYKILSSDSNITSPLNDTFNRITKVKATNTSSVTIPIEEYRKIEVALAGLQEAQSFSFWLVSTLCS